MVTGRVHTVALHFVEGSLDVVPVCAGCPWRGTPTSDYPTADVESDHHERTAVLELETGPFPGAPLARLTPHAREILAALLPDEPTVLSQQDGVTATSLARRGLAVKDGRRGWRRTRRGTAFLAES